MWILSHPEALNPQPPDDLRRWLPSAMSTIATFLFKVSVVFELLAAVEATPDLFYRSLPFVPDSGMDLETGRAADRALHPHFLILLSLQTWQH